MAYALFCQDIKISRAYPTEAEVWKHATENELVIDVAPVEGQFPQRVLDKDYTIRPCGADETEQMPDPKVTDFALHRSD